MNSISLCAASLVMVYEDPPAIVRPAAADVTVMMDPIGSLGFGWDRMN